MEYNGNMKILVTGVAGFIGYHTAFELSVLGHEVYGIDNINDYYDQKLKWDRLGNLQLRTNFSFREIDI